MQEDLKLKVAEACE